MAPSTPNDRADDGPWTAGVERLGFALAVVWFLVLAATRLDTTALWADEAWSLAAVNHLHMSLSSTAGNMGGYYVLLWVWGQVSTATWWLRAFSMLFAVATLWVTRRIAREIGGRRLATVAPLLLACGPMFVWTGTEARGYAVETLVTAACWWFALRIVTAAGPGATRTRRTNCLALTVLAAFGPFLHGLFFAQMVAIGCLALLDSKPWRSIRWLAIPVAATGAATLLLWSLGLDTAGSVLVGTPAAIFHSWRRWFLSPNDALAIALVLLLVAGVATSVVSGRQATGRRLRAGWALPALWVLVPVAVLLAVKRFHMMWANYYMAGIAPGIALLAARGAFGIGDALAARRSTPATHTAAVRTAAAIGVGVVLLGVALAARPVRMDEDWRGAVRVVESQAHPGDGIVFLGDPTTSPVQSRAPFEAAWREVAHGRTPTPVSPARPFGKAQRVDTYLTLAQLRAAVSSYSRIWVVDYAGFDKARHVLESAPFTTQFTRTAETDLPGDIRVVLFTRRGA